MLEEERTSSSPHALNGAPRAVVDRPFELDRPFQSARAPW
jgi:hypothetical protein